MTEAETTQQLMEHEEYEVYAPDHPCPICGSTTFEWGVVSRFTPLTYRRGFRFFRNDPSMGVKARHCLQCDHLQLFVEEELSAEQQRTARVLWAGAFVAVVIATSIVLTLLGG